MRRRFRDGKAGLRVRTGLRTRRKFDPDEIAFVGRCFQEGKSPRETSDLMNCSMRVVQTRYEILRGRKKAPRPGHRGPRKTEPPCVIAECEATAIKGRRTCERHAMPMPLPVMVGGFIRPLTGAELMRRRA